MESLGKDTFRAAPKYWVITSIPVQEQLQDVVGFCRDTWTAKLGNQKYGDELKTSICQVFFSNFFLSSSHLMNFEILRAEKQSIEFNWYKCLIFFHNGKK